MQKTDKLLEVVGKALKERNLSLVTAESCTGGGLTYCIIRNPKYSSILERGYIVYSIDSKEEVLNISPHTIKTFGVVSEESAKEMAEKALDKSKSQVSIAITGIDEEAAIDYGINKIGIVWISCASIGKNTVAKRIEVKGNRIAFCEKTIFESLKILLEFVEYD